MARRAIVLRSDFPGRPEERLGRILEFFGVPWTTLSAGEVGEDGVFDAGDCVVFGPWSACASLHRRPGGRAFLLRASAVYAYSDAQREPAQDALRALGWLPNWSVEQPSGGDMPLRVAADGVLGPMSGISVDAGLSPAEFRFVPGGRGEVPGLKPLVTAGGAPLFVRLQHEGTPVFLNASSQIVDIDAPVTGGSYDVKADFCSAVPLVACLRALFRDVMWQPQEHGACLIIDDPLLKNTYGFIDFEKLLRLMKEQGFTTNVAFIPWNWRRTTRRAARLFGEQGEHFSISVHGCDHIAREFAETSEDVLDGKAALAQSRMRRHQGRTGISHEPIMVFPQGVFSSRAPAALKRNGFIAAVNTEVTPVDETSGTLVRDVWDVAITRYGGFPIFTRRYSFHGVENFAFDMLLGKPCLIASHHQFYANACQELLQLLDTLRQRNTPLVWRSLGDVISRACRLRRPPGTDVQQVEMYACQLLVSNPSAQALRIAVRNHEENQSTVDGVVGPRGSVPWRAANGSLAFSDDLKPHAQAAFNILYKEYTGARSVRRSLRFEASVAARRMLSEFRDEYLQRVTYKAGKPVLSAGSARQC